MRLGHLNIWPPANGFIWVDLGGVALLEEVYNWGSGFEVSKATPIPTLLSASWLWLKVGVLSLLLQSPSLSAAILPWSENERL